MKWFNKKVKNGKTIIGIEQTYSTATSDTTTGNEQQTLLTPQQRLIMQLPVFSGTLNENFMDYIGKIEIMLDGYNDSEKMEMVLFRLNGKATEEYLKLNATTMEWNNFINIFKNLFPEPHATTYQELRKRKQQPGESLEEYAADIKRMVNKFFNNNNGYNERYRDNAMVKIFISNASTNIRKHLQKCQQRKQKFIKLDDVLKEAVQYDQNVQPERQGLSLNGMIDGAMSNIAETTTQ